MDIYIKPSKKFKLSGKTDVRVLDVADVFAPPEIQKRAENLKLLEVSAKGNYLISVVDIIKAIDQALPGHTINNVGEMDTLVEYNGGKEEPGFWKWIKICFICLVLFAGSSTAIMTFHSDAQVPVAFRNYYYIFFNEKVEKPLIIQIPYSIGLALGILVFFNHFAGKKITSDPTPIEVEMNIYEDDVGTTLKEIISAKQEDQPKESKKKHS